MTDSLWDGEPQPLRDWLTGREVDVDGLKSLPNWNAESPDGEPAGEPEGEPEGEPGGEGAAARRPPEDPRSTLRRPGDRWRRAYERTSAALGKLGDEPYGVPLLLSYLLHEVAEAWESSYHFGLLWDVLDAVRDCFPDHPTALDPRARRPGLPADWRPTLPAGWAPGLPADRTAAGAVLHLMDSLDAMIRAENAMVSGLPQVQAPAAEAAARHAGRAAELADGLPAEYGWLRGYVLRVAGRNDVYCTAAARAVRAAEAFLRTGAGLDGAIRELAEAEGDPRIDPRYRSEVRAHRFSLTALRESARREWLRLDQGSVVFLYPFALRGIRPGQVADRVAREAGGWTLAGTGAVRVEETLELDDVWDGADSLGRGYEGACVHLPDVLVHGLDGTAVPEGVAPTRLSAEIRISRLGNHYIRFEAECEDLSPAGLHALMFRAAPEHGAGRVVFEEAPEAPLEQWPRLSDLAVQLALDTAARLSPDDGSAEVRSAARPGMFHVVVTVERASATAGPWAPPSTVRRELTGAGEVMSTAGAQVLANPVPNALGAVAEWSRYAVDGPYSSLSSAVADITGNPALCTCNTTVLVRLGTADFVVQGDKAVAEFAASVEGLFAGWFDELADHYRRVERLREEVVGAGDGRSPGSAEVLQELSRRMDEEKILLDEFTVQVRSTLSLIRSPSLLSSPVIARFLALLLRSSGYPERVEELMNRIQEVAHEQLDVVVDKITAQRRAQEDRDEARQERRRRARMDTMLAVVAAIGVSGLGQIVQSGYGVEGLWSLLIIAAVVAVSALFGWGFRRTGGEA
ncbi:hypothetical protein [Streptomyces pini]|uniref:Uncharacterized protein n=1 Tax=Streptomyces pini TaxID=1520580 RepID=A0A1I3YNK6_9ACTN|nr:hypothetical protein [Streptomyces pini]SFK32861.1 hypothetical protein SAMN05192584_105121 [Streptomyces pini]